MIGKKIALSIAALLSAALVSRADDRASMFGIRGGDVTRATLESSDGEDTFTLWSVDFDDEGQLTAIDGAEPRLSRDARGLVTEVVTVEDDEEGQPVDIVTRLTYDGQGRVVAAETITDEDRWTYTYLYDADSRVSGRVYHSNGERETFTIVYAKNADGTVRTDADGNWTERTETADGAEYPVTQRLRLSRD